MVVTRLAAGIAVSKRGIATAVVGGSDCVYHSSRRFERTLTPLEKLHVVHREFASIARHLKPSFAGVTTIPGANVNDTAFPTVACEEILFMASRQRVQAKRVAFRQGDVQTAFTILKRYPYVDKCRGKDRWTRGQILAQAAAIHAAQSVSRRLSKG